MSEQNTQREAAVQQQQAVAQSRNLNAELQILAKFGGFNVLESSVDGIQNMNPERKARRNIFLSDPERVAERKELEKRLEMWVDMLKGNKSISEMVELCQKKSAAVSGLLSQNQLKAVEEVRQLEKSYRTVMLFYKNTDSDKIKNISIVNASMSQLTDLDNSFFIDAIANELRANYDRLDLRTNYSLLVIPGYLGSNKVVEKWAKIAHDNKVMIYTDFADLEKPDDVIEMFFDSNLSGGDVYKSNVCMTCNYLVARGRYAELGETEDLLIPPSAALAGSVYKTVMAQVTAGKKYGSMSEVDGVAFNLKKSEISEIEKIGLIPMVKEYGKVMAFSAKTLFNGDNLGLQTYSVVRVFDWVTKVLMDFLNRRAFENWNSKAERDLRGQISKFLDSIQGPGRLIEKFKILRFERDPKQKDRIFLDIHLTPYFPAKSFVIKLEGTKGDDENDWNSDYAQDA
ncbi:type VI secretion system contractile sheath protein TssC [Bacteroides ovatus]|nr:type VI secretion system contractile sheath protein TssC [Bacteroides ovatus]